MKRIVAIVEGHGEVEAIPILIRRIAGAIAAAGVPGVGKPIRVKRQRLMKEGDLEKYVELAARQSGAEGRILIVLDANGDCPNELAGEILARATAARGDRRIRAVIAKPEYEAWIVAAADSLAGQRGIRPDARAPADPEAIANPKAWLRAQMLPGQSYRETLDQPALTERFDLAQARQRAPSFDKLWRDVEELLA